VHKSTKPGKCSTIVLTASLKTAKERSGSKINPDDCKQKTVAVHVKVASETKSGFDFRKSQFAYLGPTD